MAAFVRASKGVLGLAEGRTRQSARAFGIVAAAVIALAAAPMSDAQGAFLISGGVYEGAAVNTCNDVNACEVAFSKVPVGKTLHLTHMSCWGQLTDTTSVLVLGLDGSPRHSFVAPIQVGTGNGFKNIAVSAEVLKLYTAGSRPKIRLVLTGTANAIFLECQIAGQLKP